MKKLFLFAAAFVAVLFAATAPAHATCPTNMPGCGTYTAGLSKIKELTVYQVSTGDMNVRQPGFADGELITQGMPECVSFFDGSPEGALSTCLIHAAINAIKETATLAENAAAAASTAQGTAQDALTQANAALTAVTDKQDLYFNGTKVAAPKELTGYADVVGSGGVATAYLTNNNASNGTALCAVNVDAEGGVFRANDNTKAAPTFTASVSGDRKTLTITGKRPDGVTLLGITVLSTQTNLPAATRVYYTVKCN